ncbi:MAG: hypothetical protein RLY14_2189, partial [Planctomycetota bacterium]
MRALRKRDGIDRGPACEQFFEEEFRR